MSQIRDEMLSNCKSLLEEKILSIVDQLSEGDTPEQKLSPEQIQQISDELSKSFTEHFSKGLTTVFRSEMTKSNNSQNDDAEVAAADQTITDDDLTQVDDAMTHLGARR